MTRNSTNILHQGVWTAAQESICSIRWDFDFPNLGASSAYLVGMVLRKVSAIQSSRVFTIQSLLLSIEVNERNS